jgi:hypothetical protein
MLTFIKNVLEWLLGREKKCESPVVAAPPVKRTSLSQPKPRKKVVRKPAVVVKTVAKKATKVVKKVK